MRGGGLAEDAGSGDDASTNDAMPAPVCAPGDVSTFAPAPYKPASGAHLGACSAAFIDAYYQDCLAIGATDATCAKWKPPAADAAHLACSTCILTPFDRAATLGPVLVTHGLVSINAAGCIELTDPALGPACARAIQASDECEHAACDATCEVRDAPGVRAFEQCAADVDEAGCKAWFDAATCLVAEQDGGATSLCVGVDFQTLYRNAATLFCGGAEDAGSDVDATEVSD